MSSGVTCAYTRWTRDLNPHENPAQCRAAMLLIERQLSRGDHDRSKYAFTRAQFLSHELATQARDPNSEFLLPRYHQVYPMKLSGWIICLRRMPMNTDESDWALI